MEEFALERLADFICGDDSFAPLRRSSLYLTRFFESVRLPRFQHDGSTRKTWVLKCLKQCSDDDLNKVILGLASPKTYKGNVDHLELALKSLNQVLNPEGFNLEIKGVKPVLNRIEPRLFRPLNLSTMDESKEYPKRIFVFIDGDNLLASSDIIGGSIDFIKLRDALQHKIGQFDQINYYSSSPQTLDQLKFQDKLSRLGYQINIAKGSVKSIDTLIATDAISLSAKYETIVLLSGDGDFVPLLQSLNQKRKQTIVISSKIATSSELINVATKYYSLEELVPEDFPQKARTLNTKTINPSNARVSSRVLRVFLCHSSGDKEIIRDLYQRLLKEENIAPWLDEENILAGQDWDYEIEKTICESDIVIVCCSNNSVNKKGYVQKEIVRALDIADEKPEGTIFIIPLKLNKCEIPRRLSRWQWVNYFDVNGYEQLIRSLRHRAVS